MDAGPVELARITEHPRKGKVVVAKQRLPPGRNVIQEAPLMLFPEPLSAETIYRAFLAAPSVVQAQVLGFWSPVQGPTAAVVRAEAIADPNFTGDVNTLVKVFMVVHLNGLRVRPDSGPKCSGLFVMAGRASHSCTPNCTYFTNADGRIIVRTVVPVEQGHELTIGYVSGRFGKFEYLTVCQRQAKLLAVREFSCDCPRCTAYGDDMRVFPCTSWRARPACSGYHLIHQPRSTHSPEFTPCSACSSQLSTAAAAGYLATEAKLDNQLDAIEAAEDANDPNYLVSMEPTILRLRPPHPRHAAAARIAMQQYLLACLHQRWDRGAAALEAIIQCESAVRPCSQIPYEPLGDMILEIPGLTTQHIRRAEQAYRKAMQLALTFTAKPNDFYIQLSSKLAATQARLPARDIAALASPTVCSFCGVGRLDGMPLSRCSRCLAAVYCCREHQQAQWPLHKQHCQLPPPPPPA